MKLHEQVLLNIANGERCFSADFESDDGSSLNQDDRGSWDLTFHEAVRYVEEKFPYYLTKYGEHGSILASVCNEMGEPIVVYDGKKWSVW